jgi:hypothetical protein
MTVVAVFYDGHTGADILNNEFEIGQYVGLKFSGLLNPFDTVHTTITWSDKTASPIDVTVGVQDILSGSAQAWFLFDMPNVKTTGTVLITVGNTTKQINIGVGTPAPNPKSTSTFNWLLWGGIGLVAAVGGGLLVRKLISKK